MRTFLAATYYNPHLISSPLTLPSFPALSQGYSSGSIGKTGSLSQDEFQK
jgi:hypothetical protein